MTIDPKLAEQFQQPDVGSIIYLYSLDITDITGDSDDIYYFIEGTISGTVVEYGGVEYFPANVECKGFEVTGEGTAPRPIMKIGNVGVGAGVSIATAVNSYDDVLGGIIKRKLTLLQHLDGQSDPDDTAFYEETWIVNRKKSHTKDYLEFELSAYLDFEGKYVPSRLVLRDICTHRYRTYDGGFVYTSSTCPWADGTHGYYWNIDGVKTTAGNDYCGKRLSDCKLRYALNAYSGSYNHGSSQPATTASGSVWCKTGITPNVWYMYDGTDWELTTTFDQLPTRAFPMVAKARRF